MYICVKLFLKVDKALEDFLLRYEIGFKNEVDRISDIFIEQGNTYEYAYRLFNRCISYNSKHLVLSCAKEMFYKKQDGKEYSFGFSSYWSNSSYTVTHEYLKLELGPDMYRDRLLVPVYYSKHAFLRIQQGKPMNLKLVCRKHKWIAFIFVECNPIARQEKNVMGIDIGIKVPAVTAIKDNKIHFFGNGREIRYTQRKYRAHIIAMQRHKQFKKLVKFEHKLSHALNAFDHKISKEIIDYALSNDIGIIKMENLVAINKKFKVHNNPNIYLWSYRRLQEYITYKANLHGIKVIFINPYHTSQICLACGSLNHAKDRAYICKCGYRNHRDAVAAINIKNAL